MSSKSKDKGKRFERKIAKFLSEEYNLTFERVPNSGAFTGGQNHWRQEKLNENTILFRGDIIPPHNWNLVIECKDYKELSGGLFAVLKGDSKNINKWLEELRLDANDGQDPHILFINITRIGTFFLMPSFIEYDLQGSGAVYYYKDNKYILYTLDKFPLVKNLIKTTATKNKKNKNPGA